MADAVARRPRHRPAPAGAGGHRDREVARLPGARRWSGWREQPGERIVVATATLALQSQLASNDIPAALDAVEAVTGRRPRHAILKGRTNYACLLRVRDGAAGPGQR